MVGVAVVLLTAFVVVARPAATSTADPDSTAEWHNASIEPTSTTMLAIGDSYTSGADLPERSYACRAATAMGWTCKVAAVPGTGYISGGSANRFVSNEYTGETTTSFYERIQALDTSYAPDVVLLDGGRADSFAPASAVYLAAIATIDAAQQVWPQAHVIFVRPRFLSRTEAVAPFDDEFMRRLQQDPKAAGVRFIDPLGEKALDDIDTSQLLAADGVNPNEIGDLLLVSALLTSLQNEHPDGTS